MPFLCILPQHDGSVPNRRRRHCPALRNSYRQGMHHRRHSVVTTAQVSTHPYLNPPAHLKPIYIYPGLLQIFREKAITLDNQCPALHYKCSKCNQQRPDSPQAHQCEHSVCCPICLDKFHCKDLVRTLPCDPNHMFHSKCILDWFAFQQRCPLCNEYVSNSLQTSDLSRSDSPTLPFHLRRRWADGRRAIGQRLLRFFGVDINLVRFTREITSVPANDHPLRNDVGDISSAPASSPEQDRFQCGPHMEHELHQQNGRSSSENHRASATNSRSSDANRGQQISKGPRTYSYIVHDNVRMEMNTRIPV